MDENSNSTGQHGSLKDEAKALGGKAGEKVAAAVNAHKDKVGDPLRQVAGAVDAAREALGDNGGQAPAWVTDGLGQMASQATRLADTLQNSDSRQIAQQVQQFARQSPTLFLAGCAALGFAAARILRAGAQSSEDDGQADWHEGDVGNFGLAPGETNPMGAGSML